VNTSDFHRGQRVAADLPQPVLAAWCGKVLAISGDVPVPVDTVCNKGGVIGLRCSSDVSASTPMDPRSSAFMTAS
jgi:hypothetical protein